MCEYTYVQIRMMMMMQIYLLDT